MITRKFIYDVHKEKELTLFNHEKNSANILSRVSRELDIYPIPYRLDYQWPFHLIVYINNKKLSIFAGGMSNLIEVMPLKANGSPCSSKYEKSFLTPKGLVNYILRKYGTR